MDAWLRQQTREEWRDLGFYYHRDDPSKQWHLVGSRSGLLRFCTLLRTYAADARNDTPSEHEHYGPYLYLKVMTWPEPGMDSTTIHGP